MTRPQFLAHRRLIDPTDLLSLWNPEATDRFFWERTQEQRSLVTAGAAAAKDVRGSQRFKDAQTIADGWLERTELSGDLAGAECDPRLTAGFAFSPESSQDTIWEGFPAGRLVLPQLVVSRIGDQYAATWTTRIDPHESIATARKRLESSATLPTERVPRACGLAGNAATSRQARADLPHASFYSLVERALETLASGDLEKVVVARSATVDAKAPIEARPLLSQLRHSNPGTTTFAVGRGPATFLGASPERLLRMHQNRVETWAVAGSAARGRTPEEDAQLARALIESKKEQNEHAIVVRTIADALTPACDHLDVREAPQLLQLDGIQHLETPILGQLKESVGPLELAGNLHPTPAVAGAPVREASEWILSNETFSRGWYAGALGYLTADGGAELAIALRSTLLRGTQAHCFAGAGIVPGSNAESELRETRLKLQTVLAPLMDH